MATPHCLHDPGGERCETGLIPLIDGENDIFQNGGLWKRGEGGRGGGGGGRRLVAGSKGEAAGTVNGDLQESIED